jgi:DNA-binding response OmpR family regulator
MTEHVLIVDDDTDLLESLQRFLSRQGFEVSVASDGKAARERVMADGVDIIILDVNFPGESGFDIAEDLRAHSIVPIIMLTGRGSEVDRIAGLEIGADDYVSKPFSAGELAARIRAVLRRSATHDAASPDGGLENRVGFFCGWRIDLLRRRLFSPDDVDIGLTAREFDLLVALARHPFQVRTREQLLSALRDDSVFDRAVDTRITRLRMKIETDPGSPRFILTERGVGYVFGQKVEWRKNAGETA